LRGGKEIVLSGGTALAQTGAAGADDHPAGAKHRRAAVGADEENDLEAAVVDRGRRRRSKWRWRPSGTLQIRVFSSLTVSFNLPTGDVLLLCMGLFCKKQFRVPPPGQRKAPPRRAYYLTKYPLTEEERAEFQ
jgi:hypothetical protein